MHVCEMVVDTLQEVLFHPVKILVVLVDKIIS